MENIRLLNAEGKKDIENQLISIITNKRLTVDFQPIINFSDPQLLSYEALIRPPKESQFKGPEELFRTASIFNCIEALEKACLEVCCENYQKQKIDGMLFLNVSPLTLVNNSTDSSIVENILEKFDIPHDRVVIELSEKYPLEDYEVVATAVNYYRHQGFQIAIDDLGSGYSGLRVWSELVPDYVKIDQYFIREIHKSPIKREFVRSIHEISKSLNCAVVAEGIETQEELSVVRSMGILHGQGFLLGKPSNIAVTKPPPSVLISKEISQAQSLDAGILLNEVLIKNPSLNNDARLADAADLFFKNKQLIAIPILNGNKPIGLLMREQVLEIFLEQYDREFESDQCVTLFMNNNPIIIEKNNIDSAFRKMLLNVAHNECDFIITEQGAYLGIGQVKKLFAQLNEQNIQDAKHSNPLTLLPGNVIIDEWINMLLQTDASFHVAYFDLNYFKPYNDKYGYSRGDQLIIWLGDLLTQHTHKNTDRVGHIGGDDFVVIFQSDDWKLKCEHILKIFEEKIHNYFDDEDVKAKGIYSLDRRSKAEFFPLMGLSIGVVNPDSSRCNSHHDVSQIATEAKHEAKLIGGSTLYVSRRRSPSKDSFSD